MALRKILDTPFQITFTATDVKFNSVAIDPENSLIHLGYSTLESNGLEVQQDMPETLSGVDYTNYQARKNTLGATLSASDAVSQASLEYLPGTGTIVGDKKTLDTPYIKDELCSMLAINSFAYNTDDRVIYIGFSKNINAATFIQENLTYTLTGQEYENFMVSLNANEAGGMSVTTAEVTTCLEYLPFDGTVSDI